MFNQNFFVIPDLVIVSYAGLEIVSHRCFVCGSNFIPADNERGFCSFCKDSIDIGNIMQYLKPSNISSVDYVGNIVSYEIGVDSVHYRRSSLNTKKVIHRDLFSCRYCGYSPILHPVKVIQLEADHIMPFSYKGANNSLNNLVCSCRICNMIAHDKIFHDFADKKDFILSRRRERGLETEFSTTRERFITNIVIVGMTMRRLIGNTKNYEKFWLLSEYGELFLNSTNKKANLNLHF